jgi:hypothetical protein
MDRTEAEDEKAKEKRKINLRGDMEERKSTMLNDGVENERGRGRREEGEKSKGKQRRRRKIIEYEKIKEGAIKKNEEKREGKRRRKGRGKTSCTNKFSHKYDRKV